MKLLNQRIRWLFFICLALSVGFPAGILGIIFGATKGIVALLVAGIVLTVLGFYVMPILWIRYADRRHDRSLLFMIEHEYIYTVQGLCDQTGYSEEDVRNRIMRLIRSHILVGYLFQDDRLICNTNEKQTEAARRTRVCGHCGAIMFFDGMKFQCDYCRHSESDE